MRYETNLTQALIISNWTSHPILPEPIGVIYSVDKPTYNQEMFIGRCLRSLLDQSLKFEDYELIVINDGSNDKTSELLKLYKNEIRIINNKKNKGLPFSINRGISEAKGQFVVRVDSDDYVNRDFLYTLHMFL